MAGARDNIGRGNLVQSYSLDTAVGTTPLVDYASWASGQIHSDGAATLTFHSEIDGTPYACNDADGSPVTLAVTANNSYPIPDAVFACKSLRIVADSAIDVTLSLKG